MTMPNLATALAAKPDYIALGPIYPTILKQMKWAPQGLERLRDMEERALAICRSLPSAG